MKNGKTEIILALHIHQPFGNFDDVTDAVFRKAYRPFIDTMEKFPTVNFNLHISGPLLIWIKEKYPEFIEKIKSMAQARRLELLGGSYSEAVLPVLTYENRMEQIIRYKELFKEIIGDFPLKAFWLTERVWTPEIAENLKIAGYDYTFLDSTHIEKGGKKSEDKLFKTNWNDSELIIIPIDRFLRYNFPFKDSNTIIENLKNQKFAVHADDGEKFGDWPGMYEYLYEENHLSSLLSDMEECCFDFVKVSDFINQKEKEDFEKIFIPYSSYDAMNKWSMYAEELIDIYSINDEETVKNNETRFFSGNFFNFFIKYPESNLISEKNRIFSNIFRHDEKVFTELLKSQCCCGYWHGVFGGIYLPHIRDAINLGNIEAEKKLPAGLNTIENLVFMKAEDYCLTLNLTGGAVSHFDNFDNNLNIFNAFSRKVEFYHNEITTSLYYDYHQRDSFIDHITYKICDPDSYLKNQYGEQSFSWNKNWKIEKHNTDSVALSVEDKAFIDGKIIDYKIEKEYITGKKSLKVKYRFENMPETENYYFMTEINFHNVYGDSVQVFEGDKFKLSAENFPDIEVSISSKAIIHLIPIYTHSIYHSEIEEIKQCYTALLYLPLGSDRPLSITINLLN